MTVTGTICTDISYLTTKGSFYSVSYPRLGINSHNFKILVKLYAWWAHPHSLYSSMHPLSAFRHKAPELLLYCWHSIEITIEYIHTQELAEYTCKFHAIVGWEGGFGGTLSHLFRRRLQHKVIYSCTEHWYFKTILIMQFLWEQLNKWRAELYCTLQGGCCTLHRNCMLRMFSC